MSGGGYKFNDTLKHNPGRYMEKLDVTKMKHHPLNHYVTHVQDR